MDESNIYDEYDDFGILKEDNHIDDELSQKISEIIQISRLIAKVYKAIIYDDNNTFLLTELKRLVKIEKQLYDKLNLDMHKEIIVRSILRELENIYGKSLINVFGAACNDDIENMWLYRITDKLSSMKDKNLTSFIKQLYSGDNRILKEDLEDIQYGTIDEALGKDFMHAFIYFLNEEIANCEEGKFKHNLKETKYKLIYTTDVLEDDLVSNKSNNDESLYISFGSISNLFLASKKLTERLQAEAGLSYLDSALRNLELLHDFENDNEFLKKLFTIYFRAGLALLYNNENYELLKEDIKLDVISENENPAFSCIYEYLEENNSDMSKCKYLSFTKPNNY